MKKKDVMLKVLLIISVINFCFVRDIKYRIACPCLMLFININGYRIYFY